MWVVDYWFEDYTNGGDGCPKGFFQFDVLSP